MELVFGELVLTQNHFGVTMVQILKINGGVIMKNWEPEDVIMLIFISGTILLTALLFLPAIIEALL